ncbi:MAG: hypothetical protein A3E83_06240 [Gammaproteobacteria bacterium RIFCSPHIGHO2_12_FULL_41_20]|nr:MAG: hypothetical protein A3E83_06240 [Gammaproteobacteria bacterium RIFCSPHIGHO2_12_FULL_41_20]
MLQTIRDHTQGWIAGTIITIIIITFALWGIHTYFSGGASTNIVATVNNAEITKSQLALAYERLRRQVQAQSGSLSVLSPKEDTLLKQRALQSLVQLQVLKQASLSQDYRISLNQVESYLESMPEFQINGQFSLTRFQEILSTTLLSTGEFLDLIKTSLLIDQPKLGVIFTSFALPSEVDHTISLVNQERKINYLVIPQQYFLKKGLVVPVTKVTTYYQQHKAQFKTPEQVNVEYLELSVKDLMATIHPTNDMLNKFYNDNINSYTRPAQWQLAVIQLPLSAQNKTQQVIQELNHGGSSSKILKQYPSEIGKQLQGWVTLNQIPPDLQKAVSGLMKPGQISVPVVTAQGVMLIQAVAVKEPEVQPLEKVKTQVSVAYARQKAEEQFTEMRERLATITYEHPDSLQPAAHALNLPIKTSELFSKEKSRGEGISNNKRVRDTAFNDDVLNLKNNSDLIQISPEEVVVIRMKSHTSSALLPLESVYRQIEERLKLDEANQKASQLAELIKQKLQEGTASPSQVAQSYHLSWSAPGFVGRYSTKIDSAILDTAFQLPRPQAHPVYATVKTPLGYAVMLLEQIKAGTVDKKQNAIFMEQVQNSEGLLEYELYKQGLMKKAKVAIESDS